MINIKIYRNHLLLLGAGFSFSTLAVFSEIATRLHVDGFNQMIWRTIFAAILSIIAAIGVYKQHIQISNLQLKYLLINACLFVGGITTFSLGIYLGSPIAKAVALNYAYPLIVILLSYIFFKETPSIKGWVATFLSLLSVSLLLEIWTINNFFSLNVGDMLELLNSVFFGAMIVYGKKIRNEAELHPFAILSYSYLFTIPLLFALGFLLMNVFHMDAIGVPIRVLTFEQYLSLFGLALFGMVVPMSLIYAGVSKIRAHIAGILLLTEPLWVYVFGMLLFQQNLSFWGIMGIIGIVISVILV